MRRPAPLWQYARAVLALLALGVVAAGCAQPPTFRSVLKAGYPGYVQTLPQLEPDLTSPAFQYVPGTIAAGVMQEAGTRREAEVWSFAGVDYCSPGLVLAGIQPRLMRSAVAHYHIDVGIGGKGNFGAQRAASELDLDVNELRLLRRVTVRIERTRRYGLTPAALAAARTRIAGVCPGLATAHAKLQQLDAILVADVRVDVAFKANVKIEDRLGLLSKLGFTFGFGIGQATGYTWTAPNVVFAARLGHLKRPAPKKPQPI